MNPFIVGKKKSFLSIGFSAGENPCCTALWMTTNGIEQLLAGQKKSGLCSLAYLCFHVLLKLLLLHSHINILIFCSVAAEDTGKIQFYSRFSKIHFWAGKCTVQCWNVKNNSRWLLQYETTSLGKKTFLKCTKSFLSTSYRFGHQGWYS